jgi:hypothetical protein
MPRTHQKQWADGMQSIVFETEVPSFFFFFCIRCDVLVLAIDPAISLRVISDGLVMRSERSGYPSHHYPSRFLLPLQAQSLSSFGLARLVFQSQLLYVSASYFALHFPGQRLGRTCRCSPHSDQAKGWTREESIPVRAKNVGLLYGVLSGSGIRPASFQMYTWATSLGIERI